MAILYDLIASQPDPSPFHGGGEYAKTVFAALACRAAPGQLVGGYRVDRWLDPVVREVAEAGGVDLIGVDDDRGLQRLINSAETTAFYSALPYDYGGFDFRSVHLAYTLHGLRALERPTDADEWRYVRDPKRRGKALLKRVLKERHAARHRARIRRLLETPARSATTFVPSLHTKYALLGRFPALSPGQVQVAYSPLRPIATPALSHEEVGGLLQHLGVEAGRYILLVSGDRWTKNGLRAARALDALYEGGHSNVPRTLVLGVPNPGPYLRTVRHADRFAFAGYLDARELDALYREAFALMYPSLNEGFGYPPLEAMRLGTPVISAATCSTTELYGEAVLYVDPHDEHEMWNRVLRLVLESATRQALGERGRDRAAWVETRQAEHLDQLCQSLLALAPSVNAPAHAHDR